MCLRQPGRADEDHSAATPLPGGEGGGNDHEDIEVFLVAREDIPDFIARRRAAGRAVDVKLLVFSDF